MIAHPFRSSQRSTNAGKSAEVMKGGGNKSQADECFKTAGTGKMNKLGLFLESNVKVN